MPLHWTLWRTESLTLPFLTLFRKRTRRFRRGAAIGAILVAAAAGGALLWRGLEPDDPPQLDNGPAARHACRVVGPQTGVL